jgi:hypothetical protein
METSVILSLIRQRFDRVASCLGTTGIMILLPGLHGVSGAGSSYHREPRSQCRNSAGADLPHLLASPPASRG